MNLFTAIVNGCQYPKAFTALSGICGALEVSYSSATKGKRIFAKKNAEGKTFVVMITQVELVKIPGRGKKK
jgi:hypothetical protein